MPRGRTSVPSLPVVKVLSREAWGGFMVGPHGFKAALPQKKNDPKFCGQSVSHCIGERELEHSDIQLIYIYTYTDSSLKIGFLNLCERVQILKSCLHALFGALLVLLTLLHCHDGRGGSGSSQVASSRSLLSRASLRGRAS